MYNGGAYLATPGLYMFPVDGKLRCRILAMGAYVQAATQRFAPGA
jgi:hypothetical protein